MIKNPLPLKVVSVWPEIFSVVDVDCIPFPYLKSIHVTFKDDTIWEFDINQYSKKYSEEKLEILLDTFFIDHRHEIERVDYSIDGRKAKRDISRQTTKFFKEKVL